MEVCLNLSLFTFCSHISEVFQQKFAPLQWLSSKSSESGLICCWSVSQTDPEGSLRRLIILFFPSFELIPVPGVQEEPMLDLLRSSSKHTWITYLATTEVFLNPILKDLHACPYFALFQLRTYTWARCSSRSLQLHCIRYMKMSQSSPGGTSNPRSSFNIFKHKNVFVDMIFHPILWDSKSDPPFGLYQLIWSLLKPESDQSTLTWCSSFKHVSNMLTWLKCFWSWSTS